MTHFRASNARHLLVFIVSLNKGIDLSLFLQLDWWLSLPMFNRCIIPFAVTLVTFSFGKGCEIGMRAFGRFLLSASQIVACLTQPSGIVLSLDMLTIHYLQLRPTLALCFEDPILGSGCVDSALRLLWEDLHFYGMGVRVLQMVKYPSPLQIAPSYTIGVLHKTKLGSIVLFLILNFF